MVSDSGINQNIVLFQARNWHACDQNVWSPVIVYFPISQVVYKSQVVYNLVLIYLFIIIIYRLFLAPEILFQTHYGMKNRRKYTVTVSGSCVMDLRYSKVL